MIKHTLTSQNYFSSENAMKYMGYSQFKSFLDCEARTLAELQGAYKRPITEALLVGSYVDAFFEGTLDLFKDMHPDVFTKKGDLKAEYRHAEYMIQRVQRDKKFMQYMNGEKQKIFVGKIANVPFKIKVDSFHESCIVDLKCVKDFALIWNEEKQAKEDFIAHWGYLIQGAIYTEIVRQNVGKTLPFYIAGITKEKPEPDLDIFHIDSETLNEIMNEVISLAPRFQKIKNGELAPQRCEKCAYCRATKVIVSPKSYRELKEVYEVE